MVNPAAIYPTQTTRARPVHRFWGGAKQLGHGFLTWFKDNAYKFNAEYQTQRAYGDNSTVTKQSKAALDALPESFTQIPIQDLRDLRSDLIKSKDASTGKATVNQRALLLLHPERENMIVMLAQLASPKAFASKNDLDVQRAKIATEIIDALIDNSKDFNANKRWSWNPNKEYQQSQEVYGYEIEKLLSADTESAEYFTYINKFIESRVDNDLMYYSDMSKNIKEQLERVRKELNANAFGSREWGPKHEAGLGNVVADEMKDSIYRIFTDHEFRQNIEVQEADPARGIPSGSEVLASFFDRIAVGLAHNAPVEGIQDEHYTDFIKLAQKLIRTSSKADDFEAVREEFVNEIKNNADRIQKLELQIYKAQLAYNESGTAADYNTIQERQTELNNATAEINGWYNSLDQGLEAFGDLGVKEMFYTKLLGETSDETQRQESWKNLLKLDETRADLEAITINDVQNTPGATIPNPSALQEFVIDELRQDYANVIEERNKAEARFNNLTSNTSYATYQDEINRVINNGFSPIYPGKGNNIFEQNYNAMIQVKNEERAEIARLAGLTIAPVGGAQAAVANSIIAFNPDDLNTADTINAYKLKVAKHIQTLYTLNPSDRNQENLKRYEELQETLNSYSNWDTVVDMKLQADANPDRLRVFRDFKDPASQIKSARAELIKAQAKFDNYEVNLPGKIQEFSDAYLSGDPDRGLSGYGNEVFRFFSAVEPKGEQRKQIERDLEILASNEKFHGAEIIDKISEVLLRFINNILETYFSGGKNNNG